MDQKTADKPLKGKRFFMDPKVEKSLSQKIKENIEILGGKVEAFLDRTIHFAITNEQIKKEKTKVLPISSPISNSPFGTSTGSQSSCQNNHLVNNRWKDMARRANSTRSMTASLNSVINTAKNLGIKIRHVDEVWSWLNKKTEKLKSASAGPGQLSVTKRPNEIVIKQPCIKVEDLKLKPMYEELESLPFLDLYSSGNKCPFLKTKPSSTRKPGTRKKSNDQKGFCECCQSSYLNEVKHRRSVQHINYGEKISHYVNLDQFVTTNNLGLQMFLKRQLQKQQRSPKKKLRSHSLNSQTANNSTPIPINKFIKNTTAKSDAKSSPKIILASMQTNLSPNGTTRHRYPLRSPRRKSDEIRPVTPSPISEVVSHSGKRKRSEMCEGGQSLEDCTWSRLHLSPEKNTSFLNSSPVKLESSPCQPDMLVDKEVEYVIPRRRLRSFNRVNNVRKTSVHITLTTSDKVRQLLHTSDQEASDFFGF